MKRIFFVNRFFPPDHSATSQLVGDVASHLASGGRQVHVITSQQLYERPEARLAATETWNGVEVHRVETTQFGRGKLVGRAADYLSFYAAAWRQMMRLVNKQDALVAMTDPPLMSIPAMYVARRRGAY